MKVEPAQRENVLQMKDGVQVQNNNEAALLVKHSDCVGRKGGTFLLAEMLQVQSNTSSLCPQPSCFQSAFNRSLCMLTNMFVS